MTPPSDSICYCNYKITTSVISGKSVIIPIHIWRNILNKMYAGNVRDMIGFLQRRYNITKVFFFKFTFYFHKTAYPLCCIIFQLLCGILCYIYRYHKRRVFGSKFDSKKYIWCSYKIADIFSWNRCNISNLRILCFISDNTNINLLMEHSFDKQRRHWSGKNFYFFFCQS